MFLSAIAFGVVFYLIFRKIARKSSKRAAFTRVRVRNTVTVLGFGFILALVLHSMRSSMSVQETIAISFEMVLAALTIMSVWPRTNALLRAVFFNEPIPATTVKGEPIPATTVKDESLPATTEKGESIPATTVKNAASPRRRTQKAPRRRVQNDLSVVQP